MIATNCHKITAKRIWVSRKATQESIDSDDRITRPVHDQLVIRLVAQIGHTISCHVLYIYATARLEKEYVSAAHHFHVLIHGPHQLLKVILWTPKLLLQQCILIRF